LEKTLSYRLAKILRSKLERRIHALEPRAILPVNLFAWASEVEKFYPQIRREAEAILYKDREIINFDQVLPNQRALYQGQQWKSFFLYVGGQEVPDHARVCPQTMRGLQKIPGLINAFFSILGPGTHIPAHRGPYAGILRYHLGIMIPEGDVGIRVDQEVCRWREGQSLFFDDSFEHEAWNRSDTARVILFVDLVRPLPFPLSLLNCGLLTIFKRSREAEYAYAQVMDHQVKF